MGILCYLQDLKMVNKNPKNKLLLVGTGGMGTEYAKVLQSLKKGFLAVGRSLQSVQTFTEKTGVLATAGGIENWLNKKEPLPETAIVAVDETQLGAVTRLLLKNGVHHILVEKPGGLNLADLKQTALTAKKYQAKVFVAYNRRFYASVLKAQEIIKKDGGVTSFNFDFTERSYLVEKLDKPSAVKKEWLLANSSHVIDLAFLLGGQPKKIKAYRAGGLTWHPSASIFSGSGISEKGALFSYQANWESAGRWGLEIMTPKHKLIFRPLEKLQIQKLGQMNTEEVPPKDSLDQKFKPGLYRLVQSFLASQNNLPTINEQLKNAKYCKIINDG